jgi:hypothetical protein
LHSCVASYRKIIEGFVVSLRTAINSASLHMISEELSATLAKAATDFEAFVADPNNQAALESSITEIAQVGGTLRLVQLNGAALLADEMASFLEFVKAQKKRQDTLLSAISEQFFLLPRYMEFLSSHQMDVPLLLLDAVNNLRSLRKAPLLSETQFAVQPLTTNGKLPEQPEFEADRNALVKRMRHLYQAGLLNVLRNSNAAFGWSLMARASNRIACAFSANAFDGLLFLIAATVEAFAQQQLAAGFTRKRLLGEFDKIYRAFLKNGDAAVAESNTPDLRNQLVFLLQQVSVREGLVAKVCSGLGIAVSPEPEQMIEESRRYLRGPSAEAVDTVVSVLREELHGAKDALELGAQNNSLMSEDIERLNETLLRSINIMHVLNLSGPSNLLRNQYALTREWNADTALPKELVMPVADVLLFVETGLAAVQRHDMTLVDFAALDAIGSNRAMSGNYLAEAEQIVIQEAQAGLSMIKRAITAYVDSSFDAIHIANVYTSLSAIRGGLQMLHRDRAAEAIRQCAAFMEAQSKPNPQVSNSQRRQLLELLADAVISIEYYINELAAQGSVDEKTLELAEESLSALGYPVNKKAAALA